MRSTLARSKPSCMAFWCWWPGKLALLANHAPQKHQGRVAKANAKLRQTLVVL